MERHLYGPEHNTEREQCWSPDDKTYCKATVIRTSGLGKTIDKQINGTEQSPEIDPHRYSQLISDKGAKAIQWSKDRKTNGAGKTGQLHVKE